jgi:hypothetical protein
MFDRIRTVRPSSPRPGRHPRRLTLELLEGRLAPATLTVNSTADTSSDSDPYLSLREAVALFNHASLPTDLSPEIQGQISGTLHDGGADTIAFDPDAVTRPIVLSDALLPTLPSGATAVTIDGGTAGVTLDGLLRIPLFQLGPRAQVTLAHLTLTHGNGNLGGAIYDNGGTLMVTDCTVSSNIAFEGGCIFNSGGAVTVTGSTLSHTSAVNGGAVYNAAGTVTLEGCTLSSNSADNGGGIYNLATVTVSDSTLSSDIATLPGSGGGIYNSGTLTVTSSRLTSNSTNSAGGAIYNYGGMLTVTGSTISSNTAAYAGGGISTGAGLPTMQATATIIGSTLSSNAATGNGPNTGYGGGIDNFGTHVTLTLDSSTVASNHAVNGGGIDNGVGLTIRSSTISFNSVTGSGGGIYSGAVLMVQNSTIASNTASDGGGIAGTPIAPGGSMQYRVVQESIVAGNRATEGGPDIAGTLSSSSGYDLVGDGSGLSGISNGVGGNLIGTAESPIDPHLRPLADNGGPTFTQALLDNSPARAAGNPSGAPATDQRGLPRVIAGRIDLGAFEIQTGIAGPQVVRSDPDEVVDPPVDHVRLTFNHPLDPTSVTVDAFSLTGPDGDVPITGVDAVGTSNRQQYDVSFPPQAEPGNYALAVGGSLRDSHGTQLASPYTAGFILVGAGSTLTVNSTLDTAHDSDPYLTLREAIRIVNSASLPTDLSPEILGQISGDLHANGSDTIAFDPDSVTGPITLSGSQLELSISGRTSRVTIDGGDGVTVDGHNVSRVLQVDAAVQAVLDHLTISHGRTTGDGGGILNLGTLLVADSVLSSDSAGTGGGISNSYGTLTVSDSVLSSDSAGSGGGIYSNGKLTVSSSTLSANIGGSAGGIYNDNSLLTVSSSTLSRNSAATGGGIINSSYGVVTVSDSTLYANSALNGAGGGVVNDDLGRLTVTNSTLSANSAAGSGFGGGINTGGFVLLQNSIVAGNIGLAGADVFGSVSSASSYNVVGVGVLGISDGVNHNRAGTSAQPLDPLLGPLSDQGGPTQTLPLLAGSPALDIGDPSQAGTADQRAVIRTGGVNIGAFQASAAYLVVSAPETATAGVPFDVMVSAVDPDGQPAVGYTGSITFSSADPAGAILPSDYTFSLADGGSHPFVGQTILYTAGIQDVTVNDVANDLSGTTNVNVVAGSAVAFVLTPPSNAVAGTPFDLIVTAVDAYGNTDTNYTGTVTFSTSDPDPGVVLPSDYTFQSSDGGVVTFAGGVTLFTPGQQTVTVTDLESGISGSAVVTL